MVSGCLGVGGPPSEPHLPRGLHLSLGFNGMVTSSPQPTLVPSVPENRVPSCMDGRSCRRTLVRGYPRSFKALMLVGPSRVWAADTEFCNKGARGRGINRKPHDLVSRWHGLWVHYSRVLGVSTRGVGEESMIRLCKSADCQGGEGNHCNSYAAVVAEALLNLGAYGRVVSLALGSACPSRSALDHWIPDVCMPVLPVSA